MAETGSSQTVVSVGAVSGMGARPRRLAVIVGTGTDVGKTWVAAGVLAGLRAAALSVAARKPAQSFDPEDDPAARDAAVLAAASGEPPETVCLPHRWYEVPMAPPMAAEVLGRPGFGIADLVDELRWPSEPAGTVDVGLVEMAGGVCSPLADDGDCVAFCDAVSPDTVLLVAEAGLGSLNSVRLSLAALAGQAGRGVVVVVLNRFDPADDLHRRNRAWLMEREHPRVVSLPHELADLVALVRGA